jgi:hypothetical protein
MDYKVNAISLLALLFISLAIGIFFKIINIQEGITNAQTYENSAIADATKKGYSSGFAGSGSNVTSDKTDYSMYGNAPTKKEFEKLSTYKSGRATDLDIQYHETPGQIGEKADTSSITRIATVIDKSGNKVILPSIQAQESVTYYQPGTFIYGSSSYVPTYEDSVYLSRTAGGTFLDSKYSVPITSAPYIQGGICTYYANNPDRLEQACNNVDPNACASTSCCVLLGGSKCVSGNQTGATMKANYSDRYIKNRDYYYFQGKCYGNCP